MKFLCLPSGSAWTLPKQTGNAKWSPTPTRAVGRLWKKVLSQDFCSDQLLWSPGPGGLPDLKRGLPFLAPVSPPLGNPGKQALLLHYLGLCDLGSGRGPLSPAFSFMFCPLSCL